MNYCPSLTRGLGCPTGGSNRLGLGCPDFRESRNIESNLHEETSPNSSPSQYPFWLKSLPCSCLLAQSSSRIRPPSHDQHSFLSAVTASEGSMTSSSSQVPFVAPRHSESYDIGSLNPAAKQLHDFAMTMPHPHNLAGLLGMEFDDVRDADAGKIKKAYNNAMIKIHPDKKPPRSSRT